MARILLSNERYRYWIILLCAWRPDPDVDESGVARSGLGIEVLERAGLDLALLDERVHLVRLQPNHAAASVGRHAALIDESIQGARRDAEPGRRVGRRQPRDI